jgi:hypothetical protein
MTKREGFAWWTGYAPGKPAPDDPGRLIPLDREELLAEAERFRAGADRFEAVGDGDTAAKLREQASRLDVLDGDGGVV